MQGWKSWILGALGLDILAEGMEFNRFVQNDGVLVVIMTCGDVVELVLVPIPDASTAPETFSGFNFAALLYQVCF